MVWRKPRFEKMGQSRPLFLYLDFSAQLTLNKWSIWIRATDLWYRKQPLYQLSQNTHLAVFDGIDLETWKLISGAKLKLKQV